MNFAGSDVVLDTNDDSLSSSGLDADGSQEIDSGEIGTSGEFVGNSSNSNVNSQENSAQNAENSLDEEELSDDEGPMVLRSAEKVEKVEKKQIPTSQGIIVNRQFARSGTSALTGEDTSSSRAHAPTPTARKPFQRQYSLNTPTASTSRSPQSGLHEGSSAASKRAAYSRSGTAPASKFQFRKSGTQGSLGSGTGRFLTRQGTFGSDDLPGTNRKFGNGEKKDRFRTQGTGGSLDSAGAGK